MKNQHYLLILLIFALFNTAIVAQEVLVKGNDSSCKLTVVPYNLASGGKSNIYLAEDHDGTFGALIEYDGNTNKLKISGEHAGIIEGPHMTIERDNGNTMFSSYTQLGSDAPKIKMKKYTMTTPSTTGSTGSVSHGLDASKILSIDAIVEETNLKIPPGQSILNGHEYNIYTNESNIYLKISDSNGYNVTDNLARILVTYEE